MRPRLSTLTIVAALSLVLLGPTTAAADFQSLFDDYRTDGVIDGCSYSSSELSAGLSDIPADVRQYDPTYVEAINTALYQSAAGCGLAPAETETANEVTAADGSPGPMVEKPTALRTAGAGRDVPAMLVALIAALGAALAACVALALRGPGAWRPWRRPAGSPGRRGF